ncbi:MAG: hypothetical protein PHR30_14975 [Gallionellaceae bacterium]|nr:hypothetical protein [Gallionellaceae bacterium]
MPSHKFEYVISGVELGDEQKAAISAAIATAVSETLVGGVGNLSALVKGRVWGSIGGGIGPINGGRLLFAQDIAQLAKQLEKTVRV